MSTKQQSSFQVPLTMHLFSGFVHRTRPLWKVLGNLETRSLGDQLDAVTIDRPVYVTGLARAGTTVLLEFLSRHPGVATHKYRDFPGVFVPTWWEKGFEATAADGDHQVAIERAHGDRLKVTQNSPEAIEECLWMAFFPDAHQPDVSSVLDSDTENCQFEAFYRDHIRKLLFARGEVRYVAKGNYNLSRLAYLQKIYPDARFVVAVRHPRTHIASLMKQHRLFCNGEANFPRALSYMQRVGHYEFGIDRRLINPDNSELVHEVQSLWAKGEELRGWACYWAGLYGWFFDQLQNNLRLSSAVQLVRYEDMCADPIEVLGRIQKHCELSDSQLLETFAAGISAPDYYTPSFTDSEEEIIVTETAEVAKQYDYQLTATSTESQGSSTPQIVAVE